MFNLNRGLGLLLKYEIRIKTWCLSLKQLCYIQNVTLYKNQVFSVNSFSLLIWFIQQRVNTATHNNSSVNDNHLLEWGEGSIWVNIWRSQLLLVFCCTKEISMTFKDCIHFFPGFHWPWEPWKKYEWWAKYQLPKTSYI